MKVIVPARFTPLADPATLVVVNLTTTVQVPPGAKVAPVHAFCPALKNQPVPAPETATPLTVVCAPMFAGAVLVSVTVPVPVLSPVGSVIVSGLGVIDTVARFATPVPVSCTDDGVTVAPV